MTLILKRLRALEALHTFFIHIARTTLNAPLPCLELAGEVNDGNSESEVGEDFDDGLRFDFGFGYTTWEHGKWFDGA